MKDELSVQNEISDFSQIAFVQDQLVLHTIHDSIHLTYTTYHAGTYMLTKWI